MWFLTIRLYIFNIICKYYVLSKLQIKFNIEKKIKDEKLKKEYIFY